MQAEVEDVPLSVDDASFAYHVRDGNYALDHDMS